MNDVKEISEYLLGHKLVREVTQLERGHIRLETTFLYPDGGNIDLFLVKEGPLLPFQKLSDFGNTSSWLLDLQVRPWLSAKRRGMLEQALQSLDVKQAGGALEIDLPRLEGLMDGVVRLGQACIRMADLCYTRRSSLVSDFNETVEDIFNGSDLTYEGGVSVNGRYGKDVTVDYMVFGARKVSLVMGLATGNSSYAHTRANEVFRTWYDLDVPERTETKITIFDDSKDSYRDEDLKRIRDFSDVLPLSDRRSIHDLLAA